MKQNQSDESLGKRISCHRKRLGLTQDQLAEKVGVSPQAVSKWENDLSCPDISTLPTLAKIFGITTDELLGMETGIARQGEIVDNEPEGIHLSNSNDHHNIDISFENPKKYAPSAGLWVIAMGLMMLAGFFLKVDVSLWSAAWTTGLAVFGIHGIFNGAKFSNIVVSLIGVYFIADKLKLIHFNLSWNIVLPVLLLILGVSLIINGMRKRKRIKCDTTNPATHNCVYVQDGILVYDASFDDHSYIVDTDCLKGGRINVSYGDHVIDFSQVRKVQPGCTIELSSCFGDTLIRMPGRYRAELETANSFSDLTVNGHCEAETEGVIVFRCSVSFGDLTVEYI